MLPDLAQLSGRAAAWFDRVAPRLYVRLAVAVLLAGLHLGAFAKLADDKLHLPFSASSEAPYFSDPDASSLGGYPRQPHYWSRLVVSRWDAQHYIGFALRGITACPTDGSGGAEKDRAYLECGLGWLPAWGLTGGVVHDTLGIPADVALVLLSILAAIAVTLLWTSRVVVERMGVGAAYATLVAFNFFPSAFYLVTPYSEAATLALVLAGFVCVARDRWVLAGLAVGAATGLRISAGAFSVALACAAVSAAWTRRKKASPRWWRPLVAIPLAGWGQAVQLVLLQAFVGDATAYLRARTAFGDHRDFSRLVDPEFYLRGFGAQHMDSVMLVGGIALVVLVGRELLRRFEREERLFLVVGTIATAIISIGSLQHYWGLNRYLLLCPLLFLAAGELARRRPTLFVMWVALCAAIYWHVELCSYVSQGHPVICPCLGRMEFAMPFGS